MTLPLDCGRIQYIIQRMLNYSNEHNKILSAPTDLTALAVRLKVLSEPKRLLIINLLVEGVQCNCELGEALDMPPNLISHHLRILREAGLVNMEKDALDARWVYYSINIPALNELVDSFGIFFDPKRVKPRRQTCGPQGSLVLMDDIKIQE
jgi:ArsR family transcriptional regulator, arsenate/arsenite/antimonite-responsive transcriptional repressor